MTAAKPYAYKTKVPVENSKAELDRLLRRHGASQRYFGTDDESGVGLVGFSLNGRQVRLMLHQRDYGHRHIDGEPRRKPEQVEREQWRALLLVTKAKLEMIASGETTVEREFMADLVLPNGQTVEEALLPKIDEAYSTGTMPPLLPEFGGTE